MADLIRASDDDPLLGPDLFGAVRVRMGSVLSDLPVDLSDPLEDCPEPVLTLFPCIPEAFSRASANSEALAKRPLRSLVKAFEKTGRYLAGMDSRSGPSPHISVISSRGSDDTYGDLPVMTLYARMPICQMSVRSSGRPSFFGEYCSGAMYSGVPLSEPDNEAEPMDLERPKSLNLQHP